jgi:hypothetical protein
MRARWSVSFLVFAVACGGAKPAANTATEKPVDDKPSAETAEKPEEKPAEEEASGQMPTECAKRDDGMCVPPGKWVDKLCQDTFPSLALVMFKKGSPWTRGYLNRKTKAWNASGGASESDFVEFDEEVLVLRHRASDMGGMQVSGAGGGYDALRWNGACVTLAKEELTMTTPPKAKNARVEWRRLDDGLREKLRENQKVNDAYRLRQKECKGATMGTVSDKCVKADDALSDAIVAFAREGADLPTPQKLP